MGAKRSSNLMPRRKNVTPDLSTPAETTAPTETKSTRSRKPKVETPAAEVPVVETPKPRTRRAAKPKAEPEPVVVEAKAPRSRKPKVEADAEPSTVVEESKPARSRRGRAKVEEAPVAEAVAEPKPSRARTRTRKPTAADAALEALVAEADVAPIQWRPRTIKEKPAPTESQAARTDEPRGRRRRRGRGGSAQGETLNLAPTAEAAVEAPVTEEAVEDGEAPRGRRRRGGRRSDAKVEPKSEPTPVVAVVAAPEPPAIPMRPSIVIPPDAPQVILREGLPTLVRNGRVYPPIAFFGDARNETKAKTVIDEIRMAGEAGVHLHSLTIDFEVDSDTVGDHVALAGYLLKKVLEADPEAQVFFRVVFAAPKGWTERYPGAKYTMATGEVAEPSVCDDRFWSDAQECLERFVRQLRLLPQKDSILGVHLDRGEWFYPDGVGYDTSRAARDKFQDWARARYRNDIVSLRAAWFNGSAEFGRLEVPKYERPTDDKFVRANRQERSWVDYHLFLSDAAVNRISDLAYTVKEASDGYFVVGVSYGYTFEWSHPASGHLSLGKLLRMREIDFVAGPPSYRNREPGGAASFPGPVDSFALNGKLFLSEEDYKTSLGSGYDPDDFNPMIKTPQALESVHWRGIGAALAHGSGVTWMDLWGNGWLKTPSAWQRAEVARETMVLRMASPETPADVAVFIDERSLAYLVDQKGFNLLVQNVRESVMRSGMSAAFYLLSDLQHRETFPESKLYVFLNAWDVRPELRAAIKSRLQRGNKVLFWVYTAGLFDSGRESLERAREVTGIALKPQPFHSKTGTTIVNRRHPLCEVFEDKTNVGGAHLEPSYFAIPEDGIVLGEYTQTGLPSFVLREFRSETDPASTWKSVFLGEPIVTPSLLRTLGEMAGAHVWSFTEDVVHVRAPFLTVHCTGTGPRTITLPAKWSAYSLTNREWVSTDATSLRFTATDGSTHAFLVGVRDDLEHLLNLDPTAMLKIDKLPERDANTVDADSFSFDVPIMKLDEWMEGQEGDDIADDLLFKTRLLEDLPAVPEEEDEPLRSGRRRKRRRRGGSEETAGRRRDGESVQVDADLGMSVVFRRRDT